MKAKNFVDTFSGVFMVRLK